MTDYAQINPGKHHLGYRFPTPVLIEKLPMHSEDEHRIEVKYKHSIVLNRTLYVANVQVFSKRNGAIKVESDAMYKSIVNEFDSFASYNKIEVVINDGEEITGLIELGSKILQFKQNTLYIINASTSFEVLEATHKHKGVNNPAAICKTDYGIAWANKYGCYLYDGKQVVNLLEKGGMRRIKESIWSAFLNNPMIGYIPQQRQLIVVDDIGDDADGSCYIYDMITASWSKGASGTFEDDIKTNFINDWNGDLVYATGATPKKWSDSSSSVSYIIFKTKDIDFGHPSLRKKIYKVYFSYKGDGTAVTIKYSTNGENSSYSGQFYKCAADGSTTGATASTTPLYAGDVGTTDWVSAELKPSVSINNIKSFQISVGGGSTDANFQINDISIVYRIKGIK